MGTFYGFIDEETQVDFSQYTQLSFEDKGEATIKLFVDDQYVGFMDVWKDSQEDGREYVCLNYEIIYLDTMLKKDLVVS